MKTIALIAAAILSGCGTTPDPASRAEAADDPALERDTAELAQRGLVGSSLPELRLLATPAGREMLSRVVACALPRGAAITAITRAGMPYSFPGTVGLAPDWATHAPSDEERRRVARCVRANGHGPATA